MRPGKQGRGLEAEGRATVHCGRDRLPLPSHPPLQFAEVHEDLVALVLHLAMNAHDPHALHQRLQGLAVVFHTGTGAAEGQTAQSLPSVLLQLGGGRP